MSTLDGPQGAYPGPYAAGHEPEEDIVRFSDAECVKCHEGWPCTVENMRRTIAALMGPPPCACGKPTSREGSHSANSCYYPAAS